ncbi:MAG TPA: MFS transporter [Chloroflexota bacterium]
MSAPEARPPSPRPEPASARGVAPSWPRRPTDSPARRHGARPTGEVGLLSAISVPPSLAVLSALALAPFLPLLAAELGSTVALLGQIPAASMLVAAALGLVMGPLADRYGYRRLLLIGLAALVAGALGTAFANSYATLLALSLVGALSRAIIQPVSMTLAGTRFEGEARRRALSWASAAIAGSGIIGVPLLTGIEGLAGWRAAFVALALLALAAAALVAWVVPPDGSTAIGHLGVGQVLRAYAVLARHRPTLGLIGSNFVRGVGLWSLGLYVAAFLVEEHGLSTQAAGLSFTAFGGGMFLGSVAAAGRLGRLPPRPTVVATCVFSTLIMSAGLFLPVGAPIVMALVFVGALGNGLGNVATNGLLLADAPAGRGVTMTVNQSAFSLASAAGSSLGGLLLALGGYHLVGAAIPFFGIAAALLVWLSRPPPLHL